MGAGADQPPRPHHPRGPRRRRVAEGGLDLARLLVDGRVAGTWELGVDAGVTTVTVSPFETLPKRVVTAVRRTLAEPGLVAGGADLRIVP